MFDFYHRILGCTVDGPRDAHVNRFGGALTHLRAGSCYIDLLAYDTEHLTMEGREAVARMHAVGVGLDGRRGIADVNLSHETSTLDHLCLRIDPFDRRRLLDYFDGGDVDIVKRESAGDARVGADGVGPSLYLRDPEGNVIELKGSLIRDDNAITSSSKKQVECRMIQFRIHGIIMTPLPMAIRNIKIRTKTLLRQKHQTRIVMHLVYLCLRVFEYVATIPHSMMGRCASVASARLMK